MGSVPKLSIELRPCLQIRRLTERLFDGVEDTLEVIGLGRNLLGDNLNPVFSSGEFQNLRRLRELDLSYNKLTEIEDGLLEGCINLKVRIRCLITSCFSRV